MADLLKGNPDANTKIDATSLKSVEQASRLRPSIGNLRIERPVQSLLNDSVATVSPSTGDKLSKLKSLASDQPSIGKREIESPVQLLLNENGAAVDKSSEQPDILLLLDNISNSSNASEAPAPNAKANNPSVEPGFVNWHSDLTTAALQSKISGKPVFHFQLLGQLDQRFT